MVLQGIPGAETLHWGSAAHMSRLCPVSCAFIPSPSPSEIEAVSSVNSVWIQCRTQRIPWRHPWICADTMISFFKIISSSRTKAPAPIFLLPLGFRTTTHTQSAASLLLEPRLIQTLRLSLDAIRIAKFNYCFNYTASPWWTFISGKFPVVVWLCAANAAALSRRQRRCNRCKGEDAAGEAADPLVSFIRLSHAAARAVGPRVEMTEGGELAGQAQTDLNWSN